MPVSQSPTALLVGDHELGSTTASGDEDLHLLRQIETSSSARFDHGTAEPGATEDCYSIRFQFKIDTGGGLGVIDLGDQLEVGVALNAVDHCEGERSEWESHCLCLAALVLSSQAGRSRPLDPQSPTVELREPDPNISGQWSVVCERDLVLDPDTIRENTNFFDEIATKHNGEYDGWEAAI